MEQKTLDHKEKMMLKSARKRWMENKDIQTIADELGKAYSTVQNYFGSDQMDKFEQYFSQEEKNYIKIQLKENAEQNIEASLDLIGRAISHEDAKPRDYLKAAKERRETVKDYINMLDALGFDTSEIQEENPESGNDDVMERMREALKEKQEEEENNEQVVEA